MTNNLNPTPTFTQKDIENQEIDILDLFVVIADNFKLLVFLPLVVGLFALVLAYALPNTYESVSVLSADPINPVNPVVVTGLVSSADLLGVVAQKTGLFSNLSKEKIFRQMREIIKVSVGKQDKLMTLTTQGKTPELARQLNQFVLEQLFILSRPRGDQAAALQSQLDNEKASLAAAIAVEKALAKQLSSGKPLSEAQGRVYADILQSKSRLSANIAQFQLRQAGLNTNDLVQTPSLPETAVKPEKLRLSILAGLGSGFILLVFIFIRHALRSAGSNLETAYKLQRIRKGFLMSTIKS